jgi:hypothetical protein
VNIEERVAALEARVEDHHEMCARNRSYVWTLIIGLAIALATAIFTKHLG